MYINNTRKLLSQEYMLKLPAAHRHKPAKKDEVRYIFWIFCSVFQCRIETLVNINGERTTLPTAVSIPLPLWLLNSCVDFCFFFPFCCLGLSFPFLPACCLTKHFASFLHCTAFSHFLSLSASSRCLIHQHLLKLCVVLCINVLCPMSVSLHMQKKLEESVQDYVRVTHFWHTS